MRGAVPPLTMYVFMEWCLVKHKDNFIFVSRNETRGAVSKNFHNESTRTDILTSVSVLLGAHQPTHDIDRSLPVAPRCHDDTALQHPPSR